MSVTVIATEEYDQWLESLSERDRYEVLKAHRYLKEFGLRLGFPHASALEGSRFALRELRPSAGRSALRPIYAFDPRRQAVLLIGGDKGADKRMYDRLIPIAERVWEQHLKSLQDEDEDD
jgi:hypothetical protein